MKDKYKKVIIIFLAVYISIIVLIGLKIIVNKNFIKNYPNENQKSRLMFLSALNYYEPYIAPYNYGNYYYKQGMYEEAYEKYKDSLKHEIPKERQCAVDINISLTILKFAKRKNMSEAQELYKEAKGYLNDCISLNFEEEYLNNKSMHTENVETAEEIMDEIDGALSSNGNDDDVDIDMISKPSNVTVPGISGGGKPFGSGGGAPSSGRITGDLTNGTGTNGKKRTHIFDIDEIFGLIINGESDNGIDDDIKIDPSSDGTPSNIEIVTNDNICNKCW